MKNTLTSMLNLLNQTNKTTFSEYAHILGKYCIPYVYLRYDKGHS